MSVCVFNLKIYKIIDMVLFICIAFGFSYLFVYFGLNDSSSLCFCSLFVYFHLELGMICLYPFIKRYSRTFEGGEGVK